MAKLDAKKEIIAFLTKFFFIVVGIIVLTISGLATMYITQKITILFWLGIGVILLLSVCCLGIFGYIKKHIEEIEKL